MTNDNQGFIKIHRKFLEWEWYTDTNTKLVFLHCLLMANWKDGRFRGEVIPRGSFVSSYPQIAQQTDLSIQSVRTALNHLKSTGELTVKTTSKYSVFTVVKYGLYQEDNRQTNRQTTGKQQAANSQLTTIEEKKEKKEGKNNNREVPPSLDEVKAYCQERNNRVDAERFISFYESKGWMVGKNRMKDWKAAIRTWEKRDQKEQTIADKWMNA